MLAAVGRGAPGMTPPGVQEAALSAAAGQACNQQAMSQLAGQLAATARVWGCSQPSQRPRAASWPQRRMTRRLRLRTATVAAGQQRSRAATLRGVHARCYSPPSCYPTPVHACPTLLWAQHVKCKLICNFSFELKIFGPQFEHYDEEAWAAARTGVD